MNYQRLTTVLVFVLALAVSCCALASGAPTSQFGFQGWPYRQSTSCGQAKPTAQPECTPDCPVRPESTPAPTTLPLPTATEAPIPTSSPDSEPSILPTQTPNATQSVPPTVTPELLPSKTPAVTPSPTVVPTAKPTATPSTGGDYTTVPSTVQEENAFRLLNQDRAANGQSALTLDPELSRLARMKSCDMRDNNYFAHSSPTLGSAAEMLRNNGYDFVSVGENIAHHATVDKAQAAFMSSSGHRRNILGSQWTKVGVGVCYDAQGFVYVTQLFVR